MWPHKNGLGVRLSYGVEGNGVISVNTVENRLQSDLQLPRIYDKGNVLNEIDGCNKTLVKRQTTSYSLNSRMYDDLESKFKSKNNCKIDMNIPLPILKSYLTESNILASTIAYDPTYGNLMPIFDVRTFKGNLSAKALAYVSGESGTILNISTLNYDNVELQKLNDFQSRTNLLIPDLSNPTQVSTPETIKQIDTPRTLFDQISPFILLRTSFKIYLLECFLKKKNIMPTIRNNIEINMLGEIDTTELCNEEFADVSFNPWDFNQFAAVDTKGNFAIWKINKYLRNPISKVKLSTSECEPTVREVTELSNWKRICWGKDINNILVVSRSSVVGFELFPALKSKKLITSNTWSRIRDIHTLDHQAFLLTSKELIWFDLNNSLERKLSWKTFLNEEDPSLKMSITSNDSDFICLIYSQVSPLIFVYNLGVKDGNPYSLRDPYYIKQRNTGDLKQVQLLELNRDLYQSTQETEDEFVQDHGDFIQFDSKKFGALELSIDLGLTLTCFADKDKLTLVEYNDYRRNSTSGMVERDSQYFKKFSKNMLNKVIKKLGEDFNIEIDDNEAIQKFAFSLGEGALRLNSNKDSEQRYHSLIDFSSTIPPAVDDLDEFDSMLEQLEEFYKSKNIFCDRIVISEIKKTNKLIKLETTLNTINEIYSNLLKIFDNENLRQCNEINSMKRVAIILGGSLIKSKSNDLTNCYKNQYEANFNKITDKVKNLINQWDELGEVQTQNEVTIPDTLSPMPLIHLAIKTHTKNTKPRISSRTTELLTSQALSQPLSQSTQLANDLFPSNTQNSTQSPLKSQKRFSSQPSQRHRKKKKKGGFA